MTASPDVQPLAWDSEWLGLPVAKIVVGASNTDIDVSAAVAQARATGIRLLYLIMSPENVPANAAARACGAWLADHKLTYQLSLQSASLPVSASGITLTLATTSTSELQQLALQSGEYSRFRRDKNIGAPAFEKLYTKWLERSLEQDLVWAASLANDPRPAGMLAFALPAAYGSIELLAVAPAARRRGVGMQLVQAAQRASLQRGFSALRVVTQGINSPACRFYEQCGFRLLQSEHIYHLWL